MSRIPYHTWIRVAPDGRVAGSVSKIGSVSDPDLKKICTDCERKLREHSEHGVLWLDGHLHPKPLVTIEPERTTFLADGEDVVPVHFRGVPATFRSIKVVAGDQVFDLPAGETLDLSADTFGTIRVGVREPLLRSQDVMLVAELAPEGGR